MRRADTALTVQPSAVRVGGATKSDLLGALRERNIQLNQAAETLCADPRFTTLADEHLLEIEARSVSALGFAEGATYEALTARARESGLLECPLELAPHLRLQFLDQPEEVDETAPKTKRAPRGSLTIASAPLDDTDETPKGFYLRRMDGLLWLRGYWSWPGHVWSPEDVLVFCRADIAERRAAESEPFGQGSASREAPCESERSSSCPPPLRARRARRTRTRSPVSRAD